MRKKLENSVPGVTMLLEMYENVFFQRRKRKKNLG
jgi:hypothetical protein